MEVSTLPTALVTGSPDRVPDITIALKSAGFDILSAGTMSPVDVPDLEANSVDCYVQLPADPSLAGGGALRRTRDVIAHEMLSRFDAAAPEPLPGWPYASVDPDLDFADWRNSILCLASLREG